MADDTQKNCDTSLLAAQLSRGLDLLSPTTDNPEKNYQRFVSLMKLKDKIDQLMQKYEHAADELGE